MVHFRCVLLLLSFCYNVYTYHDLEDNNRNNCNEIHLDFILIGNTLKVSAPNDDEQFIRFIFKEILG